MVVEKYNELERRDRFLKKQATIGIMEKRNRYTPEFKAKIVMEVLREEETVNQIAGKYSLSPQMVGQWKREFVSHAGEVFVHHKNGETKLRRELQEKEARYRKIIGQLSYEVDWLGKKSGLKD